MSAKHSIKTKVQHKGGSVLIFLSSPHVHRTLAVGRAIGHAAPDGTVISFRGDIGAGKTTLAKGIAEGLGIAEPVISPTYTIISEYYGRLHLVHIDAYRLSGEDEFLQTGGEELLGAPGTLSDRMERKDRRYFAARKPENHHNGRSERRQAHDD